MRRWTVTALVASSLVGGSAAIATGCGGGDNNGGGGDTPDGSLEGASSDGRRDVVTPPFDANQADTDTQLDANKPDTNAPPFDAGIAPTGTKVLSGAFELPSQSPVTTDGYVVYLDDTDKNMKVVSLAGGGTPTTIATFNANNFISVVGTKALMWPTPGTKLPIGPMYSWSLAKGSTLIDPSAIAGLGGLSADGTKIVYVASTGTAKVGDVIVSNLDGTGKQTLQAGIATLANTKQPGCGATLAFAGGRADRVALGWCTAAGTTQTLSMYTGAGYTKSDIATNVSPNPFASFVSDPTGDKVMTVILGSDGGAGIVNLVATMTGATQPVEGGDLVAFFTNAGATAHYITGTSYRSTPTATPAPKNLATIAGLNGIYPGFLPPDQSHTLLFTQQDTATNATDLIMVDTTTAGQTGKTLQANPTASIFGDAWTADSARILFVDDVQLIGNGLVGTLRAAPVTTGIPVHVADKVWIEWALSASKIAYGDNSVNVNGPYFRTDLQILDLAAAGATPTHLVKQADGNFYPTTDHTKLVYTYKADPTTGSALNGLWVLPVP